MGYNNQTMATYQAGVRSVQELRDFIAGGRSKQSRPLANNTVARLSDHGCVIIKLHKTDIIELMADGSAKLNSGGWRTVTTKERINRFTKAGISQRNGVWYMSDGSLFYDGITIRPDGTPIKRQSPAKYEKQLREIKKQAKEYAKNFVEALKAGDVAVPGGGDCWGCLFKNSDGQTVMGNDHIRQHIKERYYVPSLLVNAGRAAGYRDEQIGLMGIGGHRLFIDPERVIYRYVVKKLQEDL